MKIAGVIAAILGLAVGAFVVWVIIKLMQHWSVI
jgi:hypothetical protein